MTYLLLPVSISSESRVVLALSERGRRETTREKIVELLGAGPKAADLVVESLGRKRWLEWATWEAYLKHLIELVAESEKRNIGFLSPEPAGVHRHDDAKQRLVFHLVCRLRLVKKIGRIL